MKAFISFSIVMVSFLSMGTDHFVRASATGPGDGTDWSDSKAWTNLPATLVRGDTYYVATGTNYALSFENIPGTSWTTVKRATTNSHGTATGWLDSYASGQAFFNPRILIAGMNFIFDGVTGGGPQSWTNGHGFKIFNSSPTNSFESILIGDKYGFPHYSSSNVVIAHVEISGVVPVSPGSSDGINASAYLANYDSLFVSNCYLHDLGGLSINFQHVTNAVIANNWIGRNASDVNNHGVLIRMDYAVNYTIANNWMEDAVGTGFAGGYDGTTGPVDWYGNVFCYSASGPKPASGETNYGNGVIMCINHPETGLFPTSWRIYNNTFANLPDGNAIRLYVAGTNCVATNNLFYGSSGATWTFLNVIHDYSAFGSATNNDNGEGHPTFLSSNPFAVGYQLSRSISGTALLSAYSVDPLGITRTNWDIGAYAYTGYVPPPSTNTYTKQLGSGAWGAGTF